MDVGSQSSNTRDSLEVNWASESLTLSIIIINQERGKMKGKRIQSAVSKK